MNLTNRNFKYVLLDLEITKNYGIVGNYKALELPHSSNIKQMLNPYF